MCISDFFRFILADFLFIVMVADTIVVISPAY